MAAELRHDWHVIAPDLRGHGDSQWSPDGHYTMECYIYDLAQLIHQQDLAPVTIVSHSLGGNISLRYTGCYPDAVKRVLAIEGLGFSPKTQAERSTVALDQRMRTWIEEKRRLAGRLPRRYPSIQDAYQRMQEENRHLSPERARHLTIHGVNQNEDGTYSWKFDNYVRSWPPYDMPMDQIQELWTRITCPTLLVNGNESFASDPMQDGRAQYFQNAECVMIKNAGHWVHHDQFDEFMGHVKRFVNAPA